MVNDTRIKLEGHEISLSRLEKVLWPENGYNKGDLVEYYARIAPYMIEHLRHRPLVFTRYPNGIEGESFYQKNAPDFLPPWIETWSWQSGDGSITRLITVEEPAALVWLANQACIEIHPWLSRQQSVLNPDFAVFDLDPSPGNSFEDVVEIALLLKQVLDDLGLKAWLKTSGAEGLHIYLPLVNKYSYGEVREFAGKIAGMISSTLPRVATIERKVKQRGDRVYVDYMQNVIGKTLCAPYSVRPRPGAPVSTPLRWEEIKDIRPQDFNIKNIFDRLDQVGDLFSPVLTQHQNIDQAWKTLNV